MSTIYSVVKRHWERTKIDIDTYFIELLPDHSGLFFRVLSRFKCLTVIGILRSQGMSCRVRRFSCLHSEKPFTRTWKLLTLLFFIDFIWNTVFSLRLLFWHMSHTVLEAFSTLKTYIKDNHGRICSSLSFVNRMYRVLYSVNTILFALCELLIVLTL